MGRIKTLLGFLVVATVIYAAWTILPVYFAEYQFEDQLASIARYSASNTEDQIRAEVIKKAKELDVPLSPENVAVIKDDNHVEINANYTVTINLPNNKQWVLSFTPTSRDKKSGDAAASVKPAKSK